MEEEPNKERNHARKQNTQETEAAEGGAPRKAVEDRQGTWQNAPKRGVALAQ